MIWTIEIDFGGRWVPLKTGFKSRDDAEWFVAGWKQANKCYKDPFRAVQVDDPRAEPKDKIMAGGFADFLTVIG